jgi:hypothetical protein
MASHRVQVQEGSLRPGRFELSRLAWAILISLALHGGSYGGYKLGQKLNLWRPVHLPSWLEKMAAALKEQKEQEKREQEPSLVFVDVNPQLAVTEAPKDAKYYSDKNAKASNPDADKETDVPKISGQQTDFVKTEDIQRTPMDKLQPSFPQAQREQPEEKAKPTAPTPGDLTLAKPDITLRPDTGTAEHTRPRTIKEALRQNRNQTVGQKSKQEGGTSRRLEFTSLDTKATAFGAYDAAFVAAVEQRWFDLMDTLSAEGYRLGRVVVQFQLNYDGRITDLKIVENNVGETLGLLCQKAILDPAPFDKWPREMRLMVDKDYRDIQFAFYYN